MARFLVTGATGFVGQAVVRRLLTDGHEVIALSGIRPGALAAKNLTWRSADLLSADVCTLAALVGQERVSHCVHCAWYTNHADYLTADINRDWLAASARLAEGFSAGGGRRFIGLGTCLEYDQASRMARFSEDDTELRPDTLYAQCKVELFERLSARAVAGRGEFAWARLFFIYGPGDRANRLVPYILDNLSRGMPVSARFGGLRRDYIHVDDLATQIAKISLASVGGAINTGTGAATRVADVFQMAGALFERPDLVHVNDAIPDEARSSIQADMGRFCAEVGPVDARSLQAGLAALIGARR